MPDDKKKQAMSLLFGDAPPKPRTEAPDPPAPLADAPQEPPAKPSTPKRGGVTPTPPQDPDAGVTPDPYYQGASRYRRQSGEQVKHSVYLDPDVSQAIKVAAAIGNDPRGTNVSAIVNQALRDGGYGTSAR